MAMALTMNMPDPTNTHGRSCKAFVLAIFADTAPNIPAQIAKILPNPLLTSNFEIMPEKADAASLGEMVSTGVLDQKYVVQRGICRIAILLKE